MSTKTQQITPGLHYDDASHTYTLDGERIPGITEVLTAAGEIQGAEWFTPESRDRGSRVHLAAHYLLDDDLDWTTVDDSEMGYGLSVKRFLRETGAVIPFHEMPLAHPALKYGGTPDCPVAIWNCEPKVIDWKTGTYAPHHALQLAAQVELVRANAANLGLRPDEIPHRGLIVSLHRTGRYTIHDPRTQREPITQAQAWAKFQNALQKFKEDNSHGPCTNPPY